MPNIPLITRTNPLPDLPAPVLDRERRPTVDNSGVMQAVGQLAASSKMPEVPMELGRTSEALGSIGRAISEAGSVIGAVGLKKREAESEIQIANAQKFMEDTTAKFEEWKLKNPDQNTWLPEWQRRLGEAKTQLFEKTKMHNIAYNAILPQFTRYANRSSTEVDLAATKATFAQAKGAIVEQLNRSAQAQDQPGHEAYISRGLEKGLLSGDDAKRARVNYTEKGVRQQKLAKAGDAMAWFDRESQEATDTPRLWKEKNPTPRKGYESYHKQLTSLANEADHRYQAGAAESVSKGIAKGDYTVPEQVDCIDDKGLTPELEAASKRIIEKFDPVEAENNRRNYGVENSAQLRASIAEANSEWDRDKTHYLRLMHQINTLADSEDVPDLTATLQRNYGIAPNAEDKRPEHIRSFSRSLDTFFDSKEGVYPWAESVKIGYNTQGIVITKGRDDHMREESIAARIAIEKKMRRWRMENEAAAKDPEKFARKAHSVMQGLNLAALQAFMKRQDNKGKVK